MEKSPVLSFSILFLFFFVAVVSQGNDGFRGKKGNYSGENGKREKTLTESETGKKSKKQSNGGRERERR